MREIEVYVDHARGAVAIQWPHIQGWYVLDKPPLAPDYQQPCYMVPSGMTRMVDAGRAAAAVEQAAGLVPRQRRPRRYHPIDEPNTALDGDGPDLDGTTTAPGGGGPR